MFADRHRLAGSSYDVALWCIAGSNEIRVPSRNQGGGLPGEVRFELSLILGAANQPRG